MLKKRVRLFEKSISIWPLAVLLAVVLALVPLMAGPAGAAPDSTLALDTTGSAVAEWSTAEVHVGDYSVHLKTTGAVHSGDEGRIVIALPSGTTLGDIQSISWWTYAVGGYPPHVDITLDVNGDGVVDDEDMLTAEMAYNNADGKELDEGLVPAYGEWLQTFELSADDGFGQIGNGTMLWVTKMGAGNDDAPWGTLQDWKDGVVANDPGADLPGGTTISASAPVLALEIEIDNWVLQSEAYLDDITINGVVYELEVIPCSISPSHVSPESGQTETFVYKALDEDGVPVGGISVDWTVTGINAALQDVETETDESGEATAVLLATKPAGTATITATGTDPNTGQSCTSTAVVTVVLPTPTPTAVPRAPTPTPTVVPPPAATPAPAEGFTQEYVTPQEAVTLETPEEDATVEVPAGALREPAFIEVRTPTIEEIPALPSGFVAGSKLIEINFKDMEGNVTAVTLEMPVTGQGIQVQHLRLDNQAGDPTYPYADTYPYCNATSAYACAHAYAHAYGGTTGHRRYNSRPRSSVGPGPDGSASPTDRRLLPEARALREYSSHFIPP